MPRSSNSQRHGNVFSNFDTRVLIVVLIILFGAFLFWMVQMKNHVDCGTVKIKVQANKYAVGEVISFDVDAANADKYEWDFGDATEVQRAKDPMHKFNNAGVYIVSVKVNGNCVKQQRVEIRNLGALVDSKKMPEIISPQALEVGKPVQFDLYYQGDIKSAEWSFGESGKVDSKDIYPTYEYKDKGTFRVTVIVNGDYDHIATKTVYVKPITVDLKTKAQQEREVYRPRRPDEAFERSVNAGNEDPLVTYVKTLPLKPNIGEETERQIESKKAPNISTDKLETLFEGVAEQTKTKEDFEPYICTNYSLPVTVNGDTFSSFEAFCKKIKGKKIKIESIEVKRDQNNCITNMDIDYKVKRYMIWVKE